MHRIVLCVALLLAASSAFAAPATQHVTMAEVKQNLVVIGGNLTEKAGRHGRTYLRITIDESKVANEIPTLQMLGFLNPDVPAEEAEMKPVTDTLVLAQVMAAFTMMAIFAEQKVDHVRLVCDVAMPDMYGNAANHHAFTFDFSRALYRRINWPAFKPSNLMFVAPHFVWTKWAMAQLIQERELQQLERQQ